MLNDVVNKSYYWSHNNHKMSGVTIACGLYNFARFLESFVFCIAGKKGDWMPLSSQHPLCLTRKRRENMNDKTLKNFIGDLEFRDNNRRLSDSHKRKKRGDEKLRAVFIKTTMRFLEMFKGYPHPRFKI